MASPADEGETRISFSSSQWTVLAWSGRPSACLSILGSSIIIFMIFHKKSRLELVHSRLLLGMSFIDILNSAALGFSTAATPSSAAVDGTDVHEKIYGAYGTHETCTLQGFFITLGFSVPLYNAFLAFYYMAVISYNVKDDVLKKWERYYMHTAAVLIPLGYAILGVAMDIYGNTGGVYCFIKPSNLSGNDDDDSGEVAKFIVEIALYCYGSLFALAFLFVLVSMVIVYRTVRKQTIIMRRYRGFSRRGSFVANESSSGTQYETAIQAFLYMGAFLFTYTLPLVFIIADIDGFVWYVVASILTPLQGIEHDILICVTIFLRLLTSDLNCHGTRIWFIILSHNTGAWNCVAYIRPKYKDMRLKNSNGSLFGILKSVILSSGEDSTPNNQHLSRRDSLNRASNILNRDNSGDISPGAIPPQEKSTDENNSNRGAEKSCEENHFSDHSNAASEDATDTEMIINKNSSDQHELKEEIKATPPSFPVSLGNVEEIP